MSTPKHAPIYTQDLTAIYNQLVVFKNSTLTEAALKFDINEVTCVIEINQPNYVGINQDFALQLPKITISTEDYNCTVLMNSYSKQICLCDTKSHDTIYTITFSDLDSINNSNDIRDYHNIPFMQQVLTMYQVLKHFPVLTETKLTQDEIIQTVIQGIKRQLDHFEEREVETSVPKLQDMNDITSVLSYINSLDKLPSTTQDVELQIKAVVNGTQFITTLGNKLSVTIVHPQDANIEYSVQYNPKRSSVVYVINKVSGDVLYQIPAFVLEKTDFEVEEDVEALRNTYELYDSIYAGFTVLNHFRDNDMYRINEKVDDIKQAYYKAIL